MAIDAVCRAIFQGDTVFIMWKMTNDVIFASPLAPETGILYTYGQTGYWLTMSNFPLKGVMACFRYMSNSLLISQIFWLIRSLSSLVNFLSSFSQSILGSSVGLFLCLRLFLIPSLGRSSAITCRLRDPFLWNISSSIWILMGTSSAM